MPKHKDIIISPENGACPSSLSSKRPLERLPQDSQTVLKTTTAQTRGQLTLAWHNSYTFSVTLT